MTFLFHCIMAYNSHHYTFMDGTTILSDSFVQFGVALQTVETLVLHLLFIGTLVFSTLRFRQLSKAYSMSIFIYICTIEIGFNTSHSQVC